MATEVFPTMRTVRYVKVVKIHEKSIKVMKCEIDTLQCSICGDLIPKGNTICQAVKEFGTIIHMCFCHISGEC